MIGTHLILEFFGCGFDVLNDKKLLEKAVLEAIERANLTILHSYSHPFSPQGVSVVVVVAESHVSIHTWPEYDYAAIDIYTCGNDSNAWRIFENLRERLKPRSITLSTVERGKGTFVGKTDFFVEGKELRYFERVTKNHGRYFRVDEVLFSGRSPYQQIEVLRNRDFGKMLFLNNAVQTTTSDYWAYHEVLVHPVLVTHPEPKDVLIVGGGDGCAAREVLKHKRVERVVLVELDRCVVEVVRRFMPELCEEVFEDERLEVVFEEGRSFVEREKSESYDVVIVDLTDPREGVSRLYTKEFYEELRRTLRREGLMVTHSEASYFNEHVFLTIHKTLEAVFPIVRGLLSPAPSFGVCWTFVIGSKRWDPTQLKVEEVEERLKGVATKFYSSKLHHSLLTLPKYLEEELRNWNVLSTDKEPCQLIL